MSLETQWVPYLIGAWCIAAAAICYSFLPQIMEFLFGPRANDDNKQMEYLAKYDMRRRKK